MEESLTECSLERKSQDNNNKIIVIACIILVLCFVAGLILGLGYNVDEPVKQIKDNVDFDDLKRRVTPPNPEQVQKRIDKINGANSPSLVVAPTSSTSKPKAKPNGKPQVTPVSMDDDDESFPAYTG